MANNSWNPIDTDLVAGNVKNGVDIFGVVGSYNWDSIANWWSIMIEDSRKFFDFWDSATGATGVWVERTFFYVVWWYSYVFLFADKRRGGGTMRMYWGILKIDNTTWVVVREGSLEANKTVLYRPDSVYVDWNIHTMCYDSDWENAYQFDDSSDTLSYVASYTRSGTKQTTAVTWTIMWQNYWTNNLAIWYSVWATVHDIIISQLGIKQI